MLSVRVAGVSGRLPQLQRLTVVRPTLLRRWYGDAAKESAPLAQRYPRTFPSAVKRVLPMLCERGSWNYAEAWVKDAEADGGIKCIATFRYCTHVPPHLSPMLACNGCGLLCIPSERIALLFFIWHEREDVDRVLCTGHYHVGVELVGCLCGTSHSSRDEFKSDAHTFGK